MNSKVVEERTEDGGKVVVVNLMEAGSCLTKVIEALHDFGVESIKKE